MITTAYTPQLYLLTALTNLHVGSGKNNYGIIDKQVQRDALTGYPNINASSLKGALREFFHQGIGADAGMINYIFGADTRMGDENGTVDHQAGNFRFLGGQLLSIPVRSNVRPFFRATCPRIVKDFREQLVAFGCQSTADDILQKLENAGSDEKLLGKGISARYFGEAFDADVFIEEVDLKAERAELEVGKEITKIFGEHLVLLDNRTFDLLTADEALPIIARNHLENGISQNLWYEQIVPRQSRFFALVLHPTSGNYGQDFGKAVQSQPVQIGGNASIGYGLCTFQSISLNHKIA